MTLTIFLTDEIAGKSFWYRLWWQGGIDPDDPYNPKDNPDHGKTCPSVFTFI